MLACQAAQAAGVLLVVVVQDCEEDVGEGGRGERGYVEGGVGVVLVFDGCYELPEHCTAIVSIINVSSVSVIVVSVVSIVVSVSVISITVIVSHVVSHVVCFLGVILLPALLRVAFIASCIAPRITATRRSTLFTKCSFCFQEKQWELRDSNSRPLDYETNALPAALSSLCVPWSFTILSCDC